jgi:hypothetical protein
MFITLQYPTHEEQILIKSITKFTKNYTPESYTMVLSEISTTRDKLWNIAIIKNVTVEITQEAQPIAYKQIQEYLYANNFK